jgi:hypothetical protein
LGRVYILPTEDGGAAVQGSRFKVQSSRVPTEKQRSCGYKVIRFKGKRLPTDLQDSHRFLKFYMDY